MGFQNENKLELGASVKAQSTIKWWRLKSLILGLIV